MFCVFCDREFNLEAIYYLVSGFLLFSLRGIFMLVLYSCLMIIILFTRITRAVKIYVKKENQHKDHLQLKLSNLALFHLKQDKKGSGYTSWNKP